MSERVTSFPFNVTGAPMYYGSAMQFLGYALWQQKAAGLVLSAWVLVVYLVALRFEDPFTEEIYRKRDEEIARVERQGVGAARGGGKELGAATTPGRVTRSGGARVKKEL